MVITDSGQNARKSVGEESEPGRDSVTALLLRMVVRSVLVTKVKLRFVTRTLVQLMEDMVITDSGQNARKSVGEESEPGRDSVTALLLRMVVRSVLVTKVKLRFVTRTLVQLTEDMVITDSGQNARKSVGEESEPGRDSVTAL